MANGDPPPFIPYPSEELARMEHYIEYLEFVVEFLLDTQPLHQARATASQIADDMWRHKNPNSPHGKDL